MYGIDYALQNYNGKCENKKCKDKEFEDRIPFYFSRKKGKWLCGDCINSDDSTWMFDLLEIIDNKDAINELDKTHKLGRIDEENKYAYSTRYENGSFVAKLECEMGGTGLAAARGHIKYYPTK
jgi:hypothetical protein